MAAEREGSALPTSGLAIMFALVLGFIAVHELPLEKARPTGGERSSDQLIDLQDAEARLWQDPFVAILRHHEELQKVVDRFDDLEKASQWIRDHAHRHRFAALKKEIQTARGKGAVMILGVTVSSAPYGEDVERRQRMRYAALARLNRAAFPLDNGDHLGYVVTRAGDPKEHCPADSTLLPEHIPYEWFSPSSERPLEKAGKDMKSRRVLVLWLSEHAFAKRPQASFETLTRCLGIVPDANDVNFR